MTGDKASPPPAVEVQKRSRTKDVEGQEDDFETISPKRTYSDLRHLQDQPWADEEVLQVLETTLVGVGAFEPELGARPTEMEPFAQYYTEFIRICPPTLFNRAMYSRFPVGGMRRPWLLERLCRKDPDAPEQAKPKTPVQLMPSVGSWIMKAKPFVTLAKKEEEVRLALEAKARVIQAEDEALAEEAAKTATLGLSLQFRTSTRPKFVNIMSSDIDDYFSYPPSVAPSVVDEEPSVKEASPVVEDFALLFAVSIRNVDYFRLMEDMSLVLAFKTTVKRAVVEQVGDDVTPECLGLTHTSGSTGVRLTVPFKSRVAATRFQSRLDATKASVAGAIATKVAFMHGIRSVTNGPVSVESFDVPTVVRGLTTAGQVISAKDRATNFATSPSVGTWRSSPMFKVRAKLEVARAQADREAAEATAAYVIEESESRGHQEASERLAAAYRNFGAAKEKEALSSLDAVCAAIDASRKISAAEARAEAEAAEAEIARDQARAEESEAVEARIAVEKKAAAAREAHRLANTQADKEAAQRELEIALAEGQAANAVEAKAQAEAEAADAAAILANASREEEEAQAAVDTEAAEIALLRARADRQVAAAELAKEQKERLELKQRETVRKRLFTMKSSVGTWVTEASTALAQLRQVKAKDEVEIAEGDVIDIKKVLTRAIEARRKATKELAVCRATAKLANKSWAAVVRAVEAAEQASAQAKQQAAEEVAEAESMVRRAVSPAEKEAAEAALGEAKVVAEVLEANALAEKEAAATAAPKARAEKEAAEIAEATASAKKQAAERHEAETRIEKKVRETRLAEGIARLDDRNLHLEDTNAQDEEAAKRSEEAIAAVAKAAAEAFEARAAADRRAAELKAKAERAAESRTAVESAVIRSKQAREEANKAEQEAKKARAQADRDSSQSRIRKMKEQSEAKARADREAATLKALAGREVAEAAERKAREDKLAEEARNDKALSAQIALVESAEAESSEAHYQLNQASNDKDQAERTLEESTKAVKDAEVSERSLAEKLSKAEAAHKIALQALELKVKASQANAVAKARVARSAEQDVATAAADADEELAEIEASRAQAEWDAVESKSIAEQQAKANVLADENARIATAAKARAVMEEHSAAEAATKAATVAEKTAADAAIAEAQAARSRAEAAEKKAATQAEDAQEAAAKAEEDAKVFDAKAAEMGEKAKTVTEKATRRKEDLQIKYEAAKAAMEEAQHVARQEREAAVDEEARTRRERDTTKAALTEVLKAKFTAKADVDKSADAIATSTATLAKLKEDVARTDARAAGERETLRVMRKERMTKAFAAEEKEMRMRLEAERSRADFKARTAAMAEQDYKDVKDRLDKEKVEASEDQAQARRQAEEAKQRMDVEKIAYSRAEKHVAEAAVRIAKAKRAAEAAIKANDDASTEAERLAAEAALDVARSEEEAARASQMRAAAESQAAASAEEMAMTMYEAARARALDDTSPEALEKEERSRNERENAASVAASAKREATAAAEVVRKLAFEEKQMIADHKAQIQAIQTAEEKAAAEDKERREFEEAEMRYKAKKEAMILEALRETERMNVINEDEVGAVGSEDQESIKEVSVGFAIKGIDFYKLEPEPKASIRESVVNDLASGAGIPKKNVRVMLSGGSVRVDARLRPAPGSSAEAIAANCSGHAASRITEAILFDVKRCPGVYAAAIPGESIEATPMTATIMETKIVSVSRSAKKAKSAEQAKELRAWQDEKERMRGEKANLEAATVKAIQNAEKAARAKAETEDALIRASERRHEAERNNHAIKDAMKTKVRQARALERAAVKKATDAEAVLVKAEQLATAASVERTKKERESADAREKAEQAAVHYSMKIDKAEMEHSDASQRRATAAQQVKNSAKLAAKAKNPADRLAAKEEAKKAVETKELAEKQAAVASEELRRYGEEKARVEPELEAILEKTNAEARAAGSLALKAEKERAAAANNAAIAREEAEKAAAHARAEEATAKEKQAEAKAAKLAASTEEEDSLAARDAAVLADEKARTDREAAEALLVAEEQKRRALLVDLSLGKKKPLRLERPSRREGFGFQLGTLSKSGYKVVAAINKGGLAERMGTLHVFDVLESINGQVVAEMSHPQVKEAIGMALAIDLVVIRMPQDSPWMKEAKRASAASEMKKSGITAATVPAVVTEDETGLRTWQVVLTKRDLSCKYGIQHLDGNLDFIRDRVGKKGFDGNSTINSTINNTGFGGESTMGLDVSMISTGHGHDSSVFEDGEFCLPEETEAEIAPETENPAVELHAQTPPRAQPSASSSREPSPPPEVTPQPRGSRSASPSPISPQDTSGMSGSSRSPARKNRHGKVSASVARQALAAMSASKNGTKDLLPETLVIKKIANDGVSLLVRWNAEHPEAEVRRRDRLLAVNGKRTIVEMQEEFRTASVTMKVARYPKNFIIELQRSETKKLGFKFAPAKSVNRNELKVIEVLPNDGTTLLEDKNLEHMREGLYHLVVTPGMRIEGVNEVSGNVEAMIQELKTAEVVHLHMRRAEAPLTSDSRENLSKKLQAMKALNSMGVSASTTTGLLGFKKLAQARQSQSQVPIGATAASTCPP
eukprot:TRINITY_DN67408_c0_g1_i1.p1 TRINITY_DN67408_c0_g1~~TRINITY_DN67408_c0_g1_i1.p1  ORF type:complete len:2635 (-),score=764.39 TRINITY_DN67408_c0_g1_i1:134-7891(-)